MRVSTMIRISPAAKPDAASPDSRLMDRLTDFARQVEARGFPGIWIGDSLGPRPADRVKTAESMGLVVALRAKSGRC